VYDLTFFKFVGGIVLDENNEPNHEPASQEHDVASVPQRTSQNKRASLKLATKVTDLKHKFEKSKSDTEEKEQEHAADDHHHHHADHHHHRKPHGPKPPLHVMTLAKGHNSGLAPRVQQKGDARIPADY